jgi:hypothetical protein
MRDRTEEEEAGKSSRRQKQETGVRSEFGRR